MVWGLLERSRAPQDVVPRDFETVAVTLALWRPAPIWPSAAVRTVVLRVAPCRACPPLSQNGLVTAAGTRGEPRKYHNLFGL